MIHKVQQTPYGKRGDGFDFAGNDDDEDCYRARPSPSTKNRQLASLRNTNIAELEEAKSNQMHPGGRISAARRTGSVPEAIREKQRRDEKERQEKERQRKKKNSQGAHMPINNIAGTRGKTFGTPPALRRSPVGGVLTTRPEATVPFRSDDFYPPKNSRQENRSSPMARRTHEFHNNQPTKRQKENGTDGFSAGLKSRGYRNYKGRTHNEGTRKSSIQLHSDPDFEPQSARRKEEPKSKPQEIIVLSDSEEDVVPEEEEVDKQEKKEFGHFPSLNAGDFHIGSMHLKGFKVSVKFGPVIHIQGSDLKIDIKYDNVKHIGLSEPEDIESHQRYICFVHIKNAKDLILPGNVEKDAYDPSSEEKEKKYLVFLVKTGLDGFQTAFKRIKEEVPNRLVEVNTYPIDKMCALTGIEFKRPPRRSERLLTEAAGDDHVLLVYPEKKAKNSVTVRIRDYNRLWPGEFLNDSIIEFYLRYTLLKAAQDDPKKLDSIHIFSTFFYSTLNPSGGADIPGYEKVAKWTQNVDIFSKKLLIVPINENFHWTIVFILRPDLIETWNEKDQIQEVAARDSEVKAPTIVYMDSFQNKKAPIFHMCRAYLKREWAEKKPDIMLDDRVFSSKTLASRYAEGTEQRNFCDCGLFLLKYAEYVMNHLNDTLERMTVKIPGLKLRKLLDPKEQAASTHPPYKDAKSWFKLPKIQAMREEIQSLICELGGIDEDDRPECPDDIKLVIQAEASRAKKQEAEEAARKKRAEERSTRTEEPRGRLRKGLASISPTLDRAKHALDTLEKSKDDRKRSGNSEDVMNEELPDRSPRKAFVRESPTEDGSRGSDQLKQREETAEMNDSDEEVVAASNIVTSNKRRNAGVVAERVAVTAVGGHTGRSEFDEVRLAPAINNSSGANKRVSAEARDSPKTFFRREELAKEMEDLDEEDAMFEQKMKSACPNDAKDIDMEPQTQDVEISSVESD